MPALGFLGGTAGHNVVSSADAPVDVLGLDQLLVGAPPVAVAVVAPALRDAWSTTTNVTLGAAWLRRTAGDKVEAVSAVCPHLGCAIGWNEAKAMYLCPCHDSTFQIGGEKVAGPSERGLDPLPVIVEGGRIKVTWVRYKLGQSRREPA